MRVAVLGLGEAGSIYAREFATSGAEVRGYDRRDVAVAPGVKRTATAAEAAEGADLVLSLTTAAGSEQAAQEVAEALSATTVYADLNAASPERKLAVAALLPRGLVVDVGVLAPVARAGLRTPALASGPGARALADLLAPLGGQIEVVSDKVGDASSRKLLRSVFMKGLAAVVFEALHAGRAADCEPWVRGQIEGELGTTGPALVERLLTGTRAHATRRRHEMEDTRNYLQVLAAPAELTEATLLWLGEIEAGHR
jgi:3-hydroxyisobutyrate dehydrogenase-like beta-hydroxyacid dehydrogenase